LEAAPTGEIRSWHSRELKRLDSVSASIKITPEYDV